MSSLAKGYQAAAPWLSAVSVLFGGVAVGVVAGVVVDRWLGSSPVATLVGSLVGMAVGFYGFIRGVLKLSQKPGAKDQEKR